MEYRITEDMIGVAVNIHENCVRLWSWMVRMLRETIKIRRSKTQQEKRQEQQTGSADDNIHSINPIAPDLFPMITTTSKKKNSIETTHSVHVYKLECSINRFNIDGEYEYDENTNRRLQAEVDQYSLTTISVSPTNDEQEKVICKERNRNKSRTRTKGEDLFPKIDYSQFDPTSSSYIPLLPSN